MNIPYKLFVVLALLLGQNVYAFDPNEQIIKKPAPVSSKVSCPAEDFSVFIRKFSNDEAIQREFTKYPLTRLDLDLNAEPEPKEIVRKLRREEIEFPLMPLSQERINLLLEIRIENVTAANAQIKLIKPDTDYQVLYFFEKNGCWRLVRIEDWSL